MKNFESEKMFVESFSADVKNGETEFVVNEKQFTCTGMEKNASKQAVYTVKLDGQTDFKKFTMPGLKKVLGVAYTAPRNFAGGEKIEASVRIKTDEEIKATAEVAVDRISTAVTVLIKAAEKYGVPAAELLSMDTAAMSAVIHARLTEARDKAAADKAAAEKAAAEQRATKLANVADLTAQLQTALASGNLARVAELSVAIKAAAK